MIRRLHAQCIPGSLRRCPYERIHMERGPIVEPEADFAAQKSRLMTLAAPVDGTVQQLACAPSAASSPRRRR